MRLPEGASFILTRLKERGHRAYVVGGCVRDALMGLEPKDFDICTSALPEEMQAVFADCRVIETGLKHGTLTVLFDHIPYEVTTFRVDGAYTDHRHPDGVTFVTQVTDDLARRDFTVNAMAWSPDTGLVDAFGGQEDLKRKLIRCVGDPATRFGEDALRILRALRFASVYGVSSEEKTAQAIHELRDTLPKVAAERIRVELGKLLCGQAAEEILREYADVLFTIMPALEPMRGFDQRTPYHIYDVWEHTLRTLAAAPATEVMRLTMLLHDAGKPAAFTLDEKGVGHAHGHPRRSAEIAREALMNLRVDNATLERVVLLVENHDYPLTPDRRILLRRLNRFGEEVLRQLIAVHRADGLGKGTVTPEIVEDWTATMLRSLDAVLAEKPCFTLKDLAVNGGDLLRAGIPQGRAVGQCLQALLEAVIDGKLPNEREALLRAAPDYPGEEA